jgi:ATP-dependent DNA helicase RecQ
MLHKGLMRSKKKRESELSRNFFQAKAENNQVDEEAESRIDYISDHLGIVKEEVINIVNLLREEKILADAKDLTAFIKKGENKTVHSILLKHSAN